MALPKPKKHEEAEENWLMSYADMITLLLCFFLLMLSVSQPKTSDIEKISKKFTEAVTDEEIKTPMTDLLVAVQQVVENNNLEQSVTVIETDDGIMLELSSSSFYKPGSAEFQDWARPILEEISVALQGFDARDYIVRVEGHTDDSPIKTAQFPSNWELSVLRATTLVRFFIDQGHEKEKLMAEGFAETAPKVPNRDELGNAIPENQALNRRIVMRIERRDK